MSRKICHVTTAHPATDVRIFHKECVSLSKAGYAVTLIAPNAADEVVNGVQILGPPVETKNRIKRMTGGAKAIYHKALEQDADLYHFHDPEFLPFAKKLKKLGKKVIYDVHEDLPRQMLAKHYLPKPLRKTVANVVERFEQSVVRNLDFVVTATPHITERFKKINPNTADIKNFPLLDQMPSPGEWSTKEDIALYIGSLAKIRGAKEIVEAIGLTDYKLELAGKFVPAALEEELKQMPGWRNVEYLGFLDREGVRHCLQKARVGIVTLHPVVNYLDALPVKLFEYMAAGIPVVASDFPLWRQIIEDADCGLLVNPLDSKAIAAAISQLLADPARAEEMGRNGRKAVEAKYNWAAEEQRLLEIYQSLFDKG